jgi:predicted MFS family arabinose efflux permease
MVMGLFGEFENIGVTLGPILGGIAWTLAGIQAAFGVYSVAALLAALVCAVAVIDTASSAKIEGREEAIDHQPDRV